MPFPQRLLADDEELILDLRPHWWSIAGPVAGGAFAVIAAGVLAAVAPAGGLRRPLQLAGAVLALAVLLLWVLPKVLRWSATHFVLTSDRLIYRSGVLSKYAREIPLERLNDVTFSQSLWERFIHAGDLLIESAGEHGQSRFTAVRHPEAVQLEIYRRMQANGARMHAPAQSAAATIPAQIEHLGRLRDSGLLSSEEFEAKKRQLLDRL